MVVQPKLFPTGEGHAMRRKSQLRGLLFNGCDRGASQRFARGWKDLRAPLPHFFSELRILKGLAHEIVELPFLRADTGRRRSVLKEIEKTPPTDTGRTGRV